MALSDRTFKMKQGKERGADIRISSIAVGKLKHLQGITVQKSAVGASRPDF
jgi:hypothetical protein